MNWMVMLAMLGVLMGAPSTKECDEQGMIPLLKRHEIQVLLNAGFAVADVAERSKTSVDTVRRVRRESEVTHVDDHDEARSRRIGRPSKTAAFAELVQRWLRDEPTLPTQELLRRAKIDGYSGSKTAFYALVAANRPRDATPIVRFEGLPGEFSQHDFGEVDVRFLDGSRRRVHFFASRLKYSRFVAVTIVENQRVETIVRCLARDFVAFGGLPLMAVFDRPRTIVTKAGVGREVKQFNATFAQAIVDIGVGVEMCAPRSGNQKGSVERLVGWVKGSFFKPRKFLDEADLQAQLAAWHHEVNHKTVSRATKVIPETRRQQELERLRPIKVRPETLALRVPAVVSPSAEVSFEGVSYSMPPAAARQAATIFVYERHLEFVAGKHRARHTRGKSGDAPVSLPEHRAAKVEAVRGSRAKLYEKRQQLLALGESALALLTELTHTYSRDAAAHVERLHAMLVEHGEERMRRAIDAAVSQGNCSVNAVQRALQSGAGERGGPGRRDRSEPPRGRARTKQASGVHRAESKRGGR